NQYVLELRGFGRAIVFQFPNEHARHRSHEQTASDRRAAFLLPMLQLLSMALEEFEEALDSPAPVIATSQVFGGRPFARRIAEQHPLGQNFSLLVAQLRDDVTQRQGRSGLFNALALDLLLRRPIQNDFGLGDPQRSRLAAMQRSAGVAGAAGVAELFELA